MASSGNAAAPSIASKEASAPVVQAETKKEPKKTISNFGGFIAGGVAACGAVTITNPIELIKTRYVGIARSQSAFPSPCKPKGFLWVSPGYGWCGERERAD